MPTRNIYDVVHTLITKIGMDEIVQTMVVGSGLSHDEAEECVQQHRAIQRLGAYDITFIGRAWYDNATTTVVMDKHVPVGLL